MKKYSFPEKAVLVYPTLIGKEFTEQQIKEVYRDVVIYFEYPCFESWLEGMKRNGFIIETEVKLSKELLILDTIEEIRQKAHENPEAYPIDYTIRLIQGIVAKGFGFESRTEWTEELKQSPRSIYSKRLEENRFYI